MWGGFFPESYSSTGSKPQQIQMQLGKLGKNGEFILDDQQKKLLKSAQDQGLKNPTTGELYKEGDSIYVIRQERSRVIPEKGTGGSQTEAQEYFANIAAQLKAGNTDLFTAITPTPGGKTFYKKFEDGIYAVDKDGEKTGTKPVKEEVLQTIYANYSK